MAAFDWPIRVQDRDGPFVPSNERDHHISSSSLVKLQWYFLHSLSSELILTDVDWNFSDKIYLAHEVIMKLSIYPIFKWKSSLNYYYIILESLPQAHCVRGYCTDGRSLSDRTSPFSWVSVQKSDSLIHISLAEWSVSAVFSWWQPCLGQAETNCQGASFDRRRLLPRWENIAMMITLLHSRKTKTVD